MPRPALLPLLALLAGCASGGGTDTPSGTPFLDVWLTFGESVNPSTFTYFLIFNVDNDDTVAPRVDTPAFEDREEIALGWDLFYIYGSPARLLVDVYKGRGGTDADGEPVRDLNGDPAALAIPPIARGPEFIGLTLESRPHPDDPGGPAIEENTLHFRFDLVRFPSTPGLPNNPARFKMGIAVTDRGIDVVENPDDGDVDDVRIFDRFFDHFAEIDLRTQTTFGEFADPQEFPEEIKPANVPALTGPFAAADLVDWEVRVTR